MADRHQRANHSPASAPPRSRPAGCPPRMPTVTRVGDPREIVVYEARARGIEVPKAFYADAMALHAARNRGSDRARDLEARVLSWCEHFGLRENLIEVECCRSCGQVLPEARTALSRAHVEGGQ